MKKLTSEQRLSMVLAVVPWLYEQGGATAEEIGTQFGLPSDQVMEVLSAVQCCEIPPYGGATLGITVLDDGEVIVDPSVWEQAQAVRKRRSRSKQRDSSGRIVGNRQGGRKRAKPPHGVAPVRRLRLSLQCSVPQHLGLWSSPQSRNRGLSE